MASTVFHHFVAADNASESFAGLKRIHGLMPYFMLKAALKISNPMAMIRGVLDLFLAQPFGGRSLLLFLNLCLPIEPYLLAWVTSLILNTSVHATDW